MGKAMSSAETKREYYKNGNTKYEEYHINDNLHREDGPAYVSYYENGDIKYKEYWLNGKPHRENGPAYISYNENGSLRSEYYYINGERLTKEEWYSRLSTKQKVNLLYGKRQ